MSQPNKARALCGKLVPESKLAFHQATCQKCKAIRGTEPKPEYKRPVEASLIKMPPEPVDDASPAGLAPGVADPENTQAVVGGEAGTPPAAEAGGATSSPPASNHPPEPQPANFDTLVKMVADRVAGMVLPAMDTLARRIDALDGGPTPPPEEPEPPEGAGEPSKPVTKPPQSTKGVKIEADSNKPLTAKQQYALSKQAFKDALAELTTEQQKAHKEAEQNSGSSGGGEGAEGAPGGGLGGIARELAPFLKLIGGGGGGNPMEQYKQISSMISEATQAQFGLIRASSEWTAGMIQAATKLGANPGDAASTMKGSLDKVLPGPPVKTE